jgi:hypothetical protein
MFLKKFSTEKNLSEKNLLALPKTCQTCQAWQACLACLASEIFLASADPRLEETHRFLTEQMTYILHFEKQSWTQDGSNS